jgi:hypothetical protein
LSVTRRQWTAVAGALVCGVVMVRLCTDIVRAGALDMKHRPRSTHELDDGAAIRSLMAQRQPGDAMLTTHLGLPAVWWYARVDLAHGSQGASLPDGGPIFEIARAAAGPDCSPADLRQALSPVRGATMYVGFEMQEHVELLLTRLAELGVVSMYRRFAESGHAAVIDLRKPPRGTFRAPGVRSGPAETGRDGCITIHRAHRW